MKYKSPVYEKTLVETRDIVLASATKLDGGAKLKETNNASADVFVSLFDMLSRD